MTEQGMDWQPLQDEWQRGGSSRAEVSNALERLARARRGLLFTWVAEAVIVAASVFFVVMALRHAANPLVATIGVFVGVGNVVVWVQRILMRLRERDSESAASVDYLAAVRRLRQQQIRLAEFVGVVLTMELVFFIPWWVVGSRVHSRRITDVGSLLTMWLPIAVIVALFVWAYRLRLAGRRDAQAIDRLQTSSNEM